MNAAYSLELVLSRCSESEHARVLQALAEYGYKLRPKPPPIPSAKEQAAMKAALEVRKEAAR